MSPRPAPGRRVVDRLFLRSTVTEIEPVAARMRRIRLGGPSLTGLAWTATALLTVVIGLGMTLVFFLPSQSRHPSVVVTGAHIIFAPTTFLFVFLAAIGTG